MCKSKPVWRIFTLLAACSVSACASFTSSVQQGPSTGAPEDGITYYMPKRGFKVSVAVDAKGVQTPSVTAGDTVPDTSIRFSLRYQQNLIGANHLTLSVNSKGLLQSSNAQTISGLDALAKAVGTLAGDISVLAGAGAGARPAAPTCSSGQTYTIVIYPADLERGPASICNFTVTGRLLSTVGAASARVNNASTSRIQQTGQQSGVFYKHDLSYVLTVQEGANQPTQFIAYSPDQSEIAFVPSVKPLFANGQSNFTFSDGIVTGLESQSESELVAILSAPAAVLTSYTTAAGGLFSAFSDVHTNEDKLIAAQQTSNLNSLKKQLCDDAWRIYAPAGKSGDDLKQAVTNIQAACQ